MLTLELKDKTPDEIMDWLDARRREDDPGRRCQEFYAAYCRSMFEGHQWISQSGGAEGYREFVNKIDATASESDGPILTTLNRITRNILRNAAASRPQKLDVTRAGTLGTPTVQGQADAGVFKAAASVGLNLSRLLGNAKRAGFERAITGLHGYGFRYVRYADGDVGVEGFDFDGYRLTLDPMNTSTDLLDHNFVIYTEPVTYDHAVRMFGKKVFDDAGIDPKQLPTMANLAPVECQFHRLSGGRMYSQFAQHCNSPSLVMTWAYIKDSPTRFGTHFVMADTGGGTGYGSKRNRVLLNKDNPINPYAGSGMPMGTLGGWDRTASRYPISDVGLMVDDQIKTNINASIYFQGLWNHVNSLLVVDKNSLGNNQSDPDSILDAVQDGLLVVQRGGDRGSLPPQYLTPPPPSPAAADGFRYFEAATRDSSFQTATNEGQTKSHVPASTTQLAVELSALPLDDRQNQDIESYESVILCMAMSVAGLGAAGAKTVSKMLMQAGLTEDQMKRLATIDLVTTGCELRIAREHVVRRSRSRRILDLQFAVNIGAITPQKYRDAMAELDMPLSDDDRVASQYVDEAVLAVVLGEPFEPIPLEEHLSSFKAAIKSAMMENRSNPEIMERLREALDDQLETEELMAQINGNIEGGGGQVQQPQPQDPGLPPELELSQVVGNSPF